MVRTFHWKIRSSKPPRAAPWGPSASNTTTAVNATTPPDADVNRNRPLRVIRFGALTDFTRGFDTGPNKGPVFLFCLITGFSSGFLPGHVSTPKKLGGDFTTTPASGVNAGAWGGGERSVGPGPVASPRAPHKPSVQF